MASMASHRKSAPLRLQQEIPINSEPTHFENDLCKGEIVVILRPPNLAPGESWRYEEYFAGRQRTMEIQVQLQMKQIPAVSPDNARLFARPRPLKRVHLSLVTNAFCKLIVAVMDRVIGRVFRYSFGDDVEVPHVSLPASSILSMKLTRPGEKPPHLGTSDMNLASVGSAEQSDVLASPIKLDNIYTFQFYSMYLDFRKWEICRIPGLSSLGLETFWGSASSLQFAAYLDSPDGAIVLFDLRLGRDGSEHPPALLEHSTCNGRAVCLERDAYVGVAEPEPEPPTPHFKGDMPTKDATGGMCCFEGLMKLCRQSSTAKSAYGGDDLQRAGSRDDRLDVPSYDVSKVLITGCDDLKGKSCPKHRGGKGGQTIYWIVIAVITSMLVCYCGASLPVEFIPVE